MPTITRENNSIKQLSVLAFERPALFRIQVVVPLAQALSHLGGCEQLLGIDDSSNWLTMVLLEIKCATIPLETDLVHIAKLDAILDLLPVNVQVFQPSSVETDLGVEGRFVKVFRFYVPIASHLSMVRINCYISKLYILYLCPLGKKNTIVITSPAKFFATLLFLLHTYGFILG